MSIGSVLGTARLALQAQQIALQTASHNIANANVDGYTRQRADIEPNFPDQTPWGSLGTGVIVGSITRARDDLLDVRYRDQAAQSGAFGARRDILTSVSDVYGEPSDTGLSSALDQFWGAWGDLANAPTSTAAKSAVQQRGAQIASLLNRYSSQLDQIVANNRDALTNQVADVNRAAAQVASLNRAIVAAEAGGHQAPDLRDERDRAIDTLSKLVPVRVQEAQNGSVTVFMSGTAIVDGVSTTPLSVQSSGSALLLQAGARTFGSGAVGGSLGATLTTLNVDLPDQRTQLDALASGIVSTVNAAHRAGWTAAGDAAGGANWDPTAGPTGSNIDFFDASGTTAATITLSSAVASDASYVAAGDVQNATGNNAVAQRIAALRTGPSIPRYGASGETISFGEYYRDQITRLGVATNAADSSATASDTLLQQADTQRQSANGVSTDDELVQVTQRQQAYAAAAKIITTADAMAQSLIDMIP